MKHSIYSTNIFEDPNYVLGSTRNTSLKHKHYCFSALAEDAWEKTADKFLYYRHSNRKIWADQTNSQVVAKTGLEAGIKEIVGYVKALAELPLLVLQDCGIACTETVNRSLKESYLGSSQWLEFHLLHNVDILLEMSPICREHYAYKANALRDLYSLIQDIYASKNELCHWTKAFSPSQLLFCCMTQFCFEDLQQKKILPGGKDKQKTESINDILQFVRAVIDRPGQLEIYVTGDEPVVSIPPYHAVLLTALKLSQQNIYYAKKRRNQSPLQKYLKALRKQAYYAKDNREMQQQRLSTDGQKLVCS